MGQLELIRDALLLIHRVRIYGRCQRWLSIEKNCQALIKTFNMEPGIDIKQMKPTDLATLHKFCCEVYSQNFYEHWEEGGLQHYLDKVFGPDILRIELSGEDIRYYVAFIDNSPVAFMKINLSAPLPGHDGKKGMELDKIYILRQFKGMKIGKRLLDLAFEIAQENNIEIFWLSVIDTNREAISFYEKAGFKFHSKTRLDYPKFKEELKGMWRMYFEVPHI